MERSAMGEIATETLTKAHKHTHTTITRRKSPKETWAQRGWMWILLWMMLWVELTPWLKTVAKTHGGSACDSPFELTSAPPPRGWGSWRASVMYAIEVKDPSVRGD